MLILLTLSHNNGYQSGRFITYSMAAPLNLPVNPGEQVVQMSTDGTYTFAYDTGHGEHQSFRVESRDPNGTVSGKFGYVGDDGVLRVSHYTADTRGYRSTLELYYPVSIVPSGKPLIVGPVPQKADFSEGRKHNEDVQNAQALRQGGVKPLGPIAAVPFDPSEPVLLVGPIPRPLQAAYSSGQAIDFSAENEVVDIPSVIPLPPLPISSLGIFDQPALGSALIKDASNILQAPLASFNITSTFLDEDDHISGILSSNDNNQNLTESFEMFNSVSFETSNLKDNVKFESSNIFGFPDNYDQEIEIILLFECVNQSLTTINDTLDSDVYDYLLNLSNHISLPIVNELNISLPIVNELAFNTHLKDLLLDCQRRFNLTFLKYDNISNNLTEENINISNDRLFNTRQDLIPSNSSKLLTKILFLNKTSNNYSLLNKTSSKYKFNDLKAILLVNSEEHNLTEYKIYNIDFSLYGIESNKIIIINNEQENIGTILLDKSTYQMRENSTKHNPVTESIKFDLDDRCQQEIDIGLKEYIFNNCNNDFDDYTNNEDTLLIECSMPGSLIVTLKCSDHKVKPQSNFKDVFAFMYLLEDEGNNVNLKDTNNDTKDNIDYTNNQIICCFNKTSDLDINKPVLDEISSELNPTVNIDQFLNTMNPAHTINKRPQLDVSIVPLQQRQSRQSNINHTNNNNINSYVPPYQTKIRKPPNPANNLIDTTQQFDISVNGISPFVKESFKQSNADISFKQSNTDQISFIKQSNADQISFMQNQRLITNTLQVPFFNTSYAKQTIVANGQNWQHVPTGTHSVNQLQKEIAPQNSQRRHSGEKIIKENPIPTNRDLSLFSQSRNKVQRGSSVLSNTFQNSSDNLYDGISKQKYPRTRHVHHFQRKRYPPINSGYT